MLTAANPNPLACDARIVQHGLEGLREDESRRPPKVGQLRQGVADRWERGVETLERFLVYYPALESFFAAKEGGQMGFAFKPEVRRPVPFVEGCRMFFFFGARARM